MGTNTQLLVDPGVVTLLEKFKQSSECKNYDKGAKMIIKFTEEEKETSRIQEILLAILSLDLQRNVYKDGDGIYNLVLVNPYETNIKIILKSFGENYNKKNDLYILQNQNSLQIH